jgi:long-chain fatty acid transport protein
MTRRPSLASLAFNAALLALIAANAHAAGFLLFQHGGRATGQAGAFTARASDPSAVFYNPAGIAHLEGLQLEAGLDFGIADDTFHLDDVQYAAKHDINFPPSVYLTWKPRDSAFTFGLGVDSPIWHTENWLPALFPRAGQARSFETRFLQLHPVLAWEIGERWSFGAGFSYVSGQLQDDHRELTTAGRGASAFVVETERSSKADGDGWAFDLGLQYREDAWGWGATLRSGGEVTGNSRNEARVDGFVPPGRDSEAQAAAAALTSSPDNLSFELPPQLSTGVWWAPYPELRLEADLDFQAWSQADNQARFARACGPVACPVSDRDWNDTLSIRLALEGNVTDKFRLAGGLAWEPSPVPSSRLEPGFPRGDAYVYAIGLGYDYPWLSFDIGYSYHDHQNRHEPGPNSGSYSASEQVFSIGARWRF